MDWKSHAKHWLTEAARTPNGERATRLDAYARDIIKVAPGTLRKYVRALTFLEEVKSAARRTGTPDQAARLDAIVDELSANEIRDLEHIQRYGRDQFEAVIEQVLGGLRKDKLTRTWESIRAMPDKRSEDLQPRNVNEFRVTNRLDRPTALQAAAACLGVAGHLRILSNAQTLAPFQADAVIVRAGEPIPCIGFRHVGDTGRPGLASRAAEIVTASLAAARAFAAFYVVTQATADADEIARRLAAVEPSGVGVIRYDAEAGTAMLLTKRRLRRSNRGLDLEGRLADLLRAAGLTVDGPSA